MTGSPQLRPLGETLGTEALGIDLSRPLDDATFAWIEQAFAEHPVLVFRDQKLGAAEIAAFGRRFGAPRIHALVKYRHPDHPEVSWLTNVDEDGKVDWYGVKRATDWHTDSTYEEELPLLAMLHALEIPSAKGGTMFADMCAAYDALPRGDEGAPRRPRRAARPHRRPRRRAALRRRARAPDRQASMPSRRARRSIDHPVTGRPILFVNPMHTHGFVGMEREEAWPLIEELAAHATQERFAYYHPGGSATC